MAEDTKKFTAADLNKQDTSLLADIEDALANCMKCGNCQAVCPIYRETKKEQMVARGKISLMQGYLSGKVPISAEFDHIMAMCLNCKSCAANCPKARPVMNKERKQARELLELEIKLARLKVTAAQIRQEKTRQQRKKQRVDFVQLAEIAAAAASEGWAQKAAFSAARGKSRWALIAAWLAWHFMRRKG